MSKKTIILCVSLVMALALGLGGTLAYLTDRDAQTNIFNIGNVDIRLAEDFQMGAKLIPGVDITKNVTVQNVGNNDAWVWVTIAIPSALDNDDASKNVIHFNYEEASVEDGLWNWLKDNTWNVAKNVKINEVNGDPNAYNVYTVLYETPLKPGEETEYSAMKKVYMDDHIDIDPNGQLNHVQNGVVEVLDWNVNTNGAPMMYVAAYAIQAEGFDTVQEAYDAYGLQWGDKGGVDYNTKYVKPESEAVRPAGYAPNVNGEDINGLVIIDDSDDVTNLRALYQNGIKDDISVTNSYLDGTYALNLTVADGYNASLYVANTTLRGWTSFSGFNTVDFVDCIFELNSEGTYNFLRSYDDTVLTGCQLFGTTIDFAADGSGNYNGGTLKLVDCYMNGEKIRSISQLNFEPDETEDWSKYVTISNSSDF